jgi:paraquat-inducible protein B
MSDLPDAVEPPEPEQTPPADAVPEARVRRRHWGLSVVWVVPLVAAIVAGYLVWDHLREAGPSITIAFTDGDGVKAGRTELRYRGVPIGEVQAIDLSRDQRHVVVTVRLRRSATPVARDGSVFWIVRPQVGPASISGLSTVLTGPYIQVQPGTGKERTKFTGVDHPSPTLDRRGLKIVLATAHLASVRNNSPIYYRGIPVGFVVDAELSRDATAAHVNAFIEQPYARLVRIGSRFWSVSGLDVHVGLFKGLDISLESLRSLAIGGVTFATPDAETPPAKPGTIFVLHEQADKEWLTWTPKIPVPATAATSPAAD